MVVDLSPPSSFSSGDGDVHLARAMSSDSISSDEGGVCRASAAKEFAMLALGVRPAEPRKVTVEQSKVKSRAKNLVGLLKRKTTSAANSAASTRDNSWSKEESIKTEFFEG